MWVTTTGEAQGISHQRHNITCQDKTYALQEGEITVIALADGAGSAKLSHIGSQVVTTESVHFIIRNFMKFIECADGNAVKHLIIDHLQHCLQKKSQELSCAMEDLASTLLLVAVSNTNHLIVHLGDGVIGYVKENLLKVASVAPKERFANQTTFITSPQAQADMRLFKGENHEISGFILMSDGAESALYAKSQQTFAKLTVKMMHRSSLVHPLVMHNYLDDLLNKIICSQSSDDCSLAFMVRESKLFCPILKMTFAQRRELYGKAHKPSIHPNQQKKAIHRYDQILLMLTLPLTQKEIAQKIKLKPKYIKKHLNRLINLGLIIKKDASYVAFHHSTSNKETLWQSMLKV